MSSEAKKRPPFRAEHVGSLLRPVALRQAFQDFKNNKIAGSAFAEAQDEAIRVAVRMQEELGFGAVTDGEFRRASYWSHLVEAVEGFEVQPARFEFRDARGDTSPFLAPHVVGPIRRTRSFSNGEFDFLKSATGRVPKITLPSPPTLHFWDNRGSLSRAGYEDIDAYFADLAAVFREEIADLAARGATYIQLDDVPMVMLCDAQIRGRLGRDGEDPDGAIDRYVRLFNDSLRDRPAGMTVALHLCRGNFKGRWLSEGGYGTVAELLFNEIDVDAFFMEFDSPRAGDFSPLAHVPPHKSVILGLVSSKSPVLESADDLKRRIEAASAYMPIENLALSPQCGFASAVSGNPITYDDQVRKLALVIEVAAEVWP